MKRIDVNEQEKPKVGFVQFLESFDQKQDWSELGFFNEFFDLSSRVDQEDFRIRVKWENIG
jgi:hypothetical protein